MTTHPWHAWTHDEIAAYHEVDAAVGLDEAMAQARLDRHGPNRPQSQPPRSAARRLLDQVLQDVRQLAADQPARAGDAGQFAQAALRLEASHPRLAALLGQVADSLAKLGI